MVKFRVNCSLNFWGGVRQTLRGAPYPNTPPEEAKHTLSCWLRSEGGVPTLSLSLSISFLTHFAFNEIASDVLSPSVLGRLLALRDSRALARRAAVVVKVTEVGCNQGSDQSGSRRYSVAISTDRRIFYQE